MGVNNVRSTWFFRTNISAFIIFDKNVVVTLKTIKNRKRHDFSEKSLFSHLSYNFFFYNLTISIDSLSHFMNKIVSKTWDFDWINSFVLTKKTLHAGGCEQLSISQSHEVLLPGNIKKIFFLMCFCATFFIILCFGNIL